MNRKQRRSKSGGDRLHPDALTELMRREAGGPHLNPSRAVPLSQWLTLDEIGAAMGIVKCIEEGRWRLSDQPGYEIVLEDGRHVPDPEGRIGPAVRRCIAAKAEPGWPYVGAPPWGDA